MSEERNTNFKFGGRLGGFWCRMMHQAAMWPIHGRYQCRVCGRGYRVPWAAEHAVQRAPIGIQRAVRAEGGA